MFHQIITMKKVTSILFALLSILITSCSQTNESKAKKVIKEYFKETLDDYDSYSPVSSSEIAMAKTKWELPKELEPELEKLEEIAKKINQSGYNNIDVASDADYFIKDLDNSSEYSHKKTLDKNMIKKIENWKALWLEFKHYQDIIYASKNSFQPEFIGWKMTHKFRAKNRVGGNELNEIEFQFDKDITKVVKARKVK